MFFVVSNLFIDLPLIIFHLLKTGVRSVLFPLPASCRCQEGVPPGRWHVHVRIVHVCFLCLAEAKAGQRGRRYGSGFTALVLCYGV